MRDISPDVLSELVGGDLRLFYLVSMQVVSTTLYMGTFIGSITWNGQTWTGLGQMGEISAVSLTAEATAESITLSLNGVPSNLVEMAMNEVRQNYPVNIYLGFADINGTVINDPVCVAVGHTDVPTLNDGGDTCRIDVTVETPMIDLQRACNRRYTPDDQKSFFPTDKGFDYVASVQSWSKTWGKK